MKYNKISITRRGFIKFLSLGAFYIIFFAGLKNSESNENNILVKLLLKMKCKKLDEPNEFGFFLVPKNAIRIQKKVFSVQKKVFSVQKKVFLENNRIHIRHIPVEKAEKTENKEIFVKPKHTREINSIKKGDQIYLDNNNFEQVYNIKYNDKLKEAHREANREVFDREKLTGS